MKAPGEKEPVIRVMKEYTYGGEALSYVGFLSLAAKTFNMQEKDLLQAAKSGANIPRPKPKDRPSFNVKRYYAELV